MIVYIIMMMISVLISVQAVKYKNYVLEYNLRKKYKKRDKLILYFNKKCFLYYILCILSFLPFMIVASIRYYVGTDYNMYLLKFKEIIDGTSTTVEIGYKFLVKIIINTTGNNQMVFAVTAFIFLFFIFKAIYEQSCNIPLSIYLLLTTCVYNYSLNIMRQLIATAIFFYAIKYIKMRKFLKYSLLIICAFLIHKTAAIYLPLYFILNKEIWKKDIGNISAVIFLVISAIFSNKIRVFIYSVLRVIGVYGGYFGSDVDRGKIGGTLLLLNLIIFILAIWLKKYIYKYTEYYNIYFNIMYITCITVVLQRIFPNADRIVFMFLPVYILFIPVLFKCIGKKTYAVILKILIILGFFVFFLYFIGYCNYGETLPYRTIF